MMREVLCIAIHLSRYQIRFQKKKKSLAGEIVAGGLQEA